MNTNLFQSALEVISGCSFPDAEGARDGGWRPALCDHDRDVGLTLREAE
jgi:hypothetical protein